MKRNRRKINRKLIIGIALIIAISIIAIIFNKGGVLDSDSVSNDYKFLISDSSEELVNKVSFSDQKQIYDEIIKDLKSGSYTLKKPLIKVNPFGVAPQSALLLFKTSKNEKVKVTIKGKNGDDIIRTFASTKEHIIPIYGLYGNYENEIILEVGSEQQSIKVKVDDICPTAGVSVNKNEIKDLNGEFYFTTSLFGTNVVAYDNFGETRWCLNSSNGGNILPLQNGNLILSKKSSNVFDTTTDEFMEIDMLGYVYNQYKVDGKYLNMSYELENGNILVLVNKISENLILEVEKKTGKIVKIWNIVDIISKLDFDYVKDLDLSKYMINSFTYNSKEKSIIVTLDKVSSILSIDYKTGELKWIIGNTKKWSNKFKDYILKPQKDDFSYPIGAKSVKVLDNGNISVVSSDEISNDFDVKCSSIEKNQTNIFVYNVDVSKKEVNLEYKFGGEKYYSFLTSSYNEGLNNHKVFNAGSHIPDDQKNDQCTISSNKVFESIIIDFDEKNDVSLEFKIFESKQDVVKFDIYNASSISSRPNKENEISNYSNENFRYITLDDESKYEKVDKKEILSYKNCESRMIDFDLTNYYLSINESIPTDSTIKLTLINGKGKAYRYIMNDLDIEKKDSVDISNLDRGRYYIYMELDGYVYNTLKYINID